jgi:AraC-like DNA-binding protein
MTAFNMESILTLLTIFNAGFSIVSCLLLIVIGSHKADALLPTASAKLSMLLMLLALAALQFFHYLSLTGEMLLFTSKAYGSILFIATSSFYLFSRAFLQPDQKSFRVYFLLLPAVLPFWIPVIFVIPIAFMFGTVYSLFICWQLYQLKESRKFFQLEMGVFIGFSFNAILILLVGLTATILKEQIFVLTYSKLIGFILIGMIYLQLRFPDLTQKAQEVVAMRYASSTLKNLDTHKLNDQLIQILKQQKAYKDPELSLSGLASKLGISNHQLSELINSHHGQGFSQLVREHRVADAKVQLVEQPKASVLSIGLDVGFSSQSNFYTAFKEMTGETPGQFRKRLGMAED